MTKKRQDLSIAPEVPPPRFLAQTKTAEDAAVATPNARLRGGCHPRFLEGPPSLPCTMALLPGTAIRRSPAGPGMLTNTGRSSTGDNTSFRSDSRGMSLSSNGLKQRRPSSMPSKRRLSSQTPSNLSPSNQLPTYPTPVTP